VTMPLLAIKAIILAAFSGLGSVSAQPFACPAAATTSCFAGIGSPYSAANSIYAAALGGTPTPSSMAGSFVCMAYTDNCPRLITQKTIPGISATNCPGSSTDYLTVYLPIKLADCPTYLSTYGPGGPPGYPTLVKLCGTANCNSPTTSTPTSAPQATSAASSSSFSMTGVLVATALAGASVMYK
jgi:hypothetical protein